MRFLLLLFTYVIQRRFDLSLSRQLDAVALRAQAKVAEKMPAVAYSGWLFFGVVAVLPALLLGIILWLLGDRFYDILALFIELVVLFVVLGCSRLKVQLDAYLQAWREENYQSAYHHAKQIGYCLNVGLDRPVQLHRAVWREFLMQTFNRYFSVIFWYMTTGVAGALLARLAEQAAAAGHNDELKRVAQRIDHFLQFIPARLLTLTFALAGNFVACIKSSKNELIDPAATSDRLLTRAAEGALTGTAEPDATAMKQSEAQVRGLLGLRDLLSRSMLIWFAVLAGLVLVGYL